MSNSSIYLCDRHFKSLPGLAEEWTTGMMGIERCVLCDDVASHDVNSLYLFGDELTKFLLGLGSDKDG